MHYTLGFFYVLGSDVLFTLLWIPFGSSQEVISGSVIKECLK